MNRRGFFAGVVALLAGAKVAQAVELEDDRPWIPGVDVEDSGLYYSTGVAEDMEEHRGKIAEIYTKAQEDMLEGMRYETPEWDLVEGEGLSTIAEGGYEGLPERPLWSSATIDVGWHPQRFSREMLEEANRQLERDIHLQVRGFLVDRYGRPLL